ncbi:hypothetical protein AR158_c594L [Paramecium bursaria Chlorella virus AR158]|uniref:hypothetical protein n=1 Tax=Paramecium bursaria Chlorella virus AR158 TaxID=380598 RepID=UPI00015AA7BB|nr:hypothetical protein AR158_c594L [Paramecium bursaria Chlorella virus AR158]ABU44139.1 hypothetical protein AR158_c594L [Paramecium bursaria Chlorella virus AR158]
MTSVQDSVFVFLFKTCFRSTITRTTQKYLALYTFACRTGRNITLTTKQTMKSSSEVRQTSFHERFGQDIVGTICNEDE